MSSKAKKQPKKSPVSSDLLLPSQILEQLDRMQIDVLTLFKAELEKMIKQKTTGFDGLSNSEYKEVQALHDKFYKIVYEEYAIKLPIKGELRCGVELYLDDDEICSEITYLEDSIEDLIDDDVIIKNKVVAKAAKEASELRKKMKALISKYATKYKVASTVIEDYICECELDI